MRRISMIDRGGRDRTGRRISVYKLSDLIATTQQAKTAQITHAIRARLQGELGQHKNKVFRDLVTAVIEPARDLHALLCCAGSSLEVRWLSFIPGWQPCELDEAGWTFVDADGEVLGRDQVGSVLYTLLPAVVQTENGTEQMLVGPVSRALRRPA